MQVMQFTRAVRACSVVYFLTQHQHETCTLCKILLFTLNLHPSLSDIQALCYFHADFTTTQPPE